MFQDGITSLERTLLIAQAENARLSSKLHTAVSDARKSLEMEYAENTAKVEQENKQLKERILVLENDKLTLRQVLIYDHIPARNYAFKHLV